MPEFIKNNFEGGLNNFVESTKIAENEYPFIRNARTRFGRVEPIRQPLLDQPAEGNVQAIEEAGNYLIVFISGRAWYKDFEDENPMWKSIPDLLMNADVEVLYTEVVPASTLNNQRTSEGSDFSTITVPSPQCLVVQDGINDPWLIFSNGVARKAKNYDEWTVDDREYVPIGTMMAYVGDILWILAPDGKTLLRSVQGRPLDFGIVIDTDGVMTADAYAYSWAVGFDAVTNLSPSDLSQGALIVTTSKFTYLVVPSTGGAFGQPLLSNVTLFATGAVNYKSLVNINGDFVFVDSNGVRSFNAVRQYNNEGGNSPLSQKVSNFFLEQTDPCAIVFDNYALFSITTPYGEGVLLFDTLTNTWTGFDQYTGVGRIKQFAQIKAANVRRLFFITEDNQIYEAFAGDDVEEAGIYLGDFYGGTASAEVSLEAFRYVMSDVRESGLLTVQCFVDEVPVDEFDCPVMQSADEVQGFPINTTGDALTHGAQSFREVRHGFKAGVYLTWQFNAKLSNAAIQFAVINSKTALDERARRYTALNANLPKVISIQPIVGTPSALISLGGSKLDSVVKVLLERRQCQIITQSTSSLQIALPNDSYTGKLYLHTANTIVLAGTIS